MSYEKDDANATTKLTYLVIGGGIGAILALLFAPKSGRELREDIADVSRKGLERGKEVATQLQDRAGDYYEVSRDKANELIDTAQQKAAEYKELAKGAAVRTANPFSAAIDAGKKAYVEEKRRTETSAIVEGRPSYPVEGTTPPKEKKS
jgi:gas vesicle protein